MVSLIRYPGSKAKLVRQILRKLPADLKTLLWENGSPSEYHEPFFGAGSVGLELMRIFSKECRIWINDADPGLVALWRTIHGNVGEFVKLCAEFSPSVAAFYRFKETDGQIMHDAMMGFQKVALHRMSFSGFGVMAGGPLGGKEQSSVYNVSCRWNLSRIRGEAIKAHKIMRRFDSFKITNADFESLISSASSRTFIYLDPPYYEKGEQLYKFNMSDDDHVRLRDSLKKTKATWMLSYDDHPRIRELYSGFRIEPIYVTYTNAVQRGGKRPKNEEILIFP